MKRSAQAFAAGLFLAALLAAAGCDSGGSVFDIKSPDIPNVLNPADFVQGVDNPLWPLAPGTEWHFRVQEQDGTVTTNDVEVLEDSRTVDGIEATVVWDRVFQDGQMIEETWDWYAQDTSGNVWYLGEETYEYQDGVTVCACGAWESGVDGARGGIFIHADPKVGDIYYQEYYAGVAEDTGEVMSLNLSVTVEAGTFEGCVLTRDTTPLDPQVLEHKYFCPGVGGVLTIDVSSGELRDELISWSKP